MPDYAQVVDLIHPGEAKQRGGVCSRRLTLQKIKSERQPLLSCQECMLPNFRAEVAKRKALAIGGEGLKVTSKGETFLEGPPKGDTHNIKSSRSAV